MVDEQDKRGTRSRQSIFGEAAETLRIKQNAQREHRNTALIVCMLLLYAPCRQLAEKADLSSSLKVKSKQVRSVLESIKHAQSGRSSLSNGAETVVGSC